MTNDATSRVLMFQEQSIHPSYKRSCIYLNLANPVIIGLMNNTFSPRGRSKSVFPKNGEAGRNLFLRKALKCNQ